MKFRPNRIFLSPPHMGGHELNYVHKAFEDNYIAPAGPNLEGFERELCEITGASYALAVSSGTAAIHLALMVLGVQSGDEVICSSFTFIASVNPVLYQGATPVFVDSEPDTWNMSPDFLEQAIQDRMRKGKKPKAIILVHLYGMPAKLLELLEIARQYEIPVIEDAAEALGSTYKKQPAGRFGTIGIYSFNGNKIITTSGGGALISENQEYINRAHFLATQAKDPAPYYLHSEVGYNYRLSNISAGIGRGQLEVLEKRVKQRRENFQLYCDAFQKLEAISFLKEPAGHFSNRWLTTILIDSATVSPEQIRQHLETCDIESRPLWKPMHLQPVFKGLPYYGEKVSESLFEKGLCLPSGSNLSEEDLVRVVKEVKKVFA
ncbi:aminotransferase class I/II-fold pyridoxal phosphate-dependent enzyme [Adhaeribacter soli]|uniref:GDP-perosamine synthase n=1 Tax=Adhaeribacter soli TaxID=2607655 RepID=A0A5N1IV40_9BACT|nr:aminotransferase class I/II-fold pyridoxal phosphate-dependent enzyme [Adhaeribacter soli]KAA9333608.1 aminotransferase class I/II-fold pyridoxal phosphate-dependent enzyme [Adhaeribacter soli]